MDGVLADFDRGVRELLKLPSVDQAHKTERQDDEMYEKMREVEHFYDLLEPIPGSLELFKNVYSCHKGKVEILTGIPKPKRGIVYAKDDKIAWVRRLLSEDVPVNVVLRREKPNFCTGSDCILIDDFIKNIKEWEQARGTGILFRSPAETADTLRRMGLF